MFKVSLILNVEMSFAGGKKNSIKMSYWVLDMNLI